MTKDCQTFIPSAFRAGASYERNGGSLLRLIGQGMGEEQMAARRWRHLRLLVARPDARFPPKPSEVFEDVVLRDSKVDFRAQVLCIRPATLLATMRGTHS